MTMRLFGPQSNMAGKNENILDAAMNNVRFE
jgi:hypothetical protein